MNVSAAADVPLHVPTSCVRHCTRWGIDSAALVEDVRGRDDFLGTDYADFTDFDKKRIKKIRVIRVIRA